MQQMLLCFLLVFKSAFLGCRSGHLDPSGLQCREALQQTATSHRMKLIIIIPAFATVWLFMLLQYDTSCAVPSQDIVADSHLLPDCLRASFSSSSKAASSSLSTSVCPALPRLPC